MPGGKVLKIYTYENGVVQPELPLTIREGRPRDAEEINAVTHVAYRGRDDAEPPYAALSETVEDVKSHLAQGGALVAVTVDMDGEHVIGAIRYREDAPGRLLGYRLAVSPPFQHHGVARKLLERLDRVALVEGCGEIHLHVRRTSPELLELYGKCGYHLVDETRGPEYSHPVYQVVARFIPGG
jgi:tRNA threonylcarbamoyladenosine biosynthesis protein TsaE